MAEGGNWGWGEGQAVQRLRDALRDIDRMLETAAGAASSEERARARRLLNEARGTVDAALFRWAQVERRDRARPLAPESRPAH